MTARGSLLAIPQHDDIDEVGDRLGVEGAVSADHHQGRVIVALGGVDGQARQVEGIEQVRVAGSVDRLTPITS